MHEYSLIQALIERVSEIAHAKGASSVKRVHVRLGALAGVDPELFETAFLTFRERTSCAGAELLLRQVPAVWRCPRCKRTLGQSAILRCSDCGIPAQLTQGDDLLLERLELEVP